MQMTDTLSETARSRVMARIKSAETSIEKKFRSIFWEKGYRFTKLNDKYFGKPDLLIKSRNVVIFIDSCFWHGCSRHLRMPSSNKLYWQTKIERNIRRDREVNTYYKKRGWKVFRAWEHDLDSIEKVLIKLENIVKK